ncbi:MAG: ribonuclease H-like domain-containing protein [Oribacterium sp.]|nr:ribonuclease H-like domain-containing protein [Oribacterium sp.]
MIRIEKVLTQPVPSDIYTIGAPEDVLFFDIETTGLSARSAGLYLIGVLTYTDQNWTLLQYFCEDVADEPAVLQAFFELLRTKKILISYNGDGFDIPFLRHMVEQYGLRAPRPHHSTALHDRADCPATDESAIADARPLYSFDTVESFDLFKKFRPLKHLLGLPDLKLKSCERFLGIDREDRFTGGELIEVYFEWQKTKAPALLDTLLLHNAEDIANLPNLLPLLRYRSLPLSDFHLRAHECLQDGATPLVHLSFTFLSPMPPSAHAPAENATREVMDDRRQHWPALTLPKPMDLRGDFWALHAEGSAVELYVQLFEGERKLFFADFEHYYYLPAEDQVIHQSLAEFVDRSARKKACARNCYQRVSGCFLPEWSEVYTPALQAEYRDKLRYAQYSDALFDDEAKAVTYLKSFLETAVH